MNIDDFEFEIHGFKHINALLLKELFLNAIENPNKFIMTPGNWSSICSIFVTKNFDLKYLGVNFHEIHIEIGRMQCLLLQGLLEDSVQNILESIINNSYDESKKIELFDIVACRHEGSVITQHQFNDFLHDEYYINHRIKVNYKKSLIKKFVIVNISEKVQNNSYILAFDADIDWFLNNNLKSVAEKIDLLERQESINEKNILNSEIVTIIRVK